MLSNLRMTSVRLVEKYLLNIGKDCLTFVNVTPFLPPSGMYDMVGNIWEWTSTVFGTDPHTRMPQYALRGGSYIDSKSGKFNHKADVTTRLVAREPVAHDESCVSAFQKRDFVRAVGTSREK